MAQKNRQNGELQQVIRFAGLPLGSLFGAAALLLLDTAASLLTPLIIGLVSASILGTPQLPELTLQQLLLLWAALVVIQAAVRYLSTRQLGKAAAAVAAGLRLRAYEHIQALPTGFFHNRNHGDILSLLSEDIRRISQLLTSTATEISPHLLTVIGAAIIILNIDILAGLAAIAVMPLVLFTIRQAGRLARPLSHKLADQQAEHASLTEENIRLNPLIKAFGRENRELARYGESNRRLFDSELQHLRISNRIPPLLQTISGLSIIGLIGIGASRIDTGSLQPAELITLILYSFYLFRPLHALGSSYGNFQSARGAAGRLAALLTTQQEPLNTSGRTLPLPSQSICFSNVSFSYPGRTRPALRDKNIEIPIGRISAIIGRNGHGKTTLVHLLMRFMDPGQGSIEIDGTDIRAFNLKSLRAAIGYVPQQIHLINGNILENIRYGLVNAGDEQVENIAHQALVTEFTRALPEGLLTTIGPGGVKLSGGQQQRIALARALLKDAPILILDEPTAMFDPQSEHTLTEQLKKTLAGRTTIIITHRPALLQIADEVIDFG